MSDLVTVPRKALANLIDWAEQERNVLHVSHFDPKTNQVEPEIADEIAQVDQWLATLRTSLA